MLATYRLVESCDQKFGLFRNKLEKLQELSDGLKLLS
jgi:hypothetical protein